MPSTARPGAPAQNSRPERREVLGNPTIAVVFVYFYKRGQRLAKQITPDMISGLILTLLMLGFCLAFYRLRHKKVAGFFSYIGVCKATFKSVLYAIPIAIMATACMLFVFAYFGLQHLVLNPNTPAWSLHTNGFNLASIGNVIVFAWVGTALWEEVFFRGFLAKRLINLIGFIPGNLVHAVIFGLMHVLLYCAIKLDIRLSAYLLLFLTPAILAYSMTYLNERVAKGSILPGYVTHALLNTITPIAAAVFF